MGRHRATVLFVLAGIAPLSSVSAGLNDRLPPAAYLHPLDQEIARTGKGIAGRPFPCAKEKIKRGISVIEDVPTDQCVRMLPSERWRGLWRDDCEGSQFCLSPADACDFNTKGDRIWLTPGPLRGKRGAVYTVEFVGRKTMYRGSYGHMGMSDHEIIVDRVISARMVQAPPPPMSKAHLITEMKRCEAAGTCIPSKEMKAMMNDSK